METTIDKATAIREARQQLRARGEVDSMNRVVALIRCSKRTARKYWPETAPEPLPEAGAQAPAPAPVPVAPAAPEPPAFTRENLRAYYLNRFESPWPQGMTPPLEARDVLLALRQEWNDEMAQADRHKYVVLNRLSQERVRDIDDHPEMRAVETRRGLARLQVHSINRALDIMRSQAHDQGIELPDPLTH